MRSVRIGVVVALCLSFTRGAFAQTADCAVGDAPDPNNVGFDDLVDCNGVCTQSGSQWNCDAGVISTSGGVRAWVIRDPSNGHDLVAWGINDTDGTDFCCVFDEGVVAVSQVGLRGTDFRDESLNFSFEPGSINELNLRPWDADPIIGYMRALDGNDILNGSNYGTSDYTDQLYGMQGNDEIDAGSGADFCYGGAGDDDMAGDDGDDVLVGMDGDDTLDGGENADILCDTTGDAVCATSGEQLFIGGSGTDIIWYDEDPGCPNRLMDSASDAGSQNDSCGDDTDWANGEMPLSCQSYITVEPVECIVP